MKALGIQVLVSLSLVVNSQGIGAQENRILIQPPSASAIGYEAFLLSEDKVISLAQHQLATWIPKQRLLKLKQQIEAQLARFGKKPGPLLLNDYRLLLKQAYSYNWPSSTRDLLGKIWLRVYELEADLKLKAELLDQLMEFHPNFHPPATEFSPPVLSAWQDVLKTRSFFTWNPQAHFRKFRYLVINGKVYNIQQTTQMTLPDRKLHISALSDTYYPVERVLNGSELIKWQPPLQILVSGSCQEPHWNPKLPKNSNYLAYFNDSCLKAKKDGLEKSLQTSDLVPHTTQPISPQLPLGPPPKPQSKRQWKWMVLAGVALGVVGYGLSRKSKKKTSDPNLGSSQLANQPVVHQGF